MKPADTPDVDRPTDHRPIDTAQPPEVAHDTLTIVDATIVDSPFDSRLRPAQSDPFRPDFAAWASSAPPRPKSSEMPAARVQLYVWALFSRRAQATLFDGRPLEKIYSVPRRFDLSTLFVVSTAFAALFALLGYLNFSSAAKLACCAFFSGVGIAQAVLYGSRAPRLSSILAGSVMLTILPIMLYLPPTPAALVCAGFGLAILGLPSGYIAGTIVGGIFLIADYLRNWITQRANRLASAQSPESPIMGETVQAPMSQ